MENKLYIDQKNFLEDIRLLDTDGNRLQFNHDRSFLSAAAMDQPMRIVSGSLKCANGASTSYSPTGVEARLTPESAPLTRDVPLPLPIDIDSFLMTKNAASGLRQFGKLLGAGYLSISLGTDASPLTPVCEALKSDLKARQR